MNPADDSSDDCVVIYESSKSESSSSESSSSEIEIMSDMMSGVAYVITLPIYDDFELYTHGNTSSRHPTTPTRLTQIGKLNPWKRSWYIKARVLYKSIIRKWSKPRSSGQYFHLTLEDESGSISAVGFTEVCDLLYDDVEVNKVYYISGCDIKRANKRYSRSSHTYELQLRVDTLFEPYVDTPQTTCTTKTKTVEIEPPIIKTWTLIDLAREAERVDGQTDIHHTEATVLVILREIDKVVYEACPSLNCNKKVVPTNDSVESYYCCKCNKKYNRFEYRFMLKVLLADWTGVLWTTFFQQAENFLGVSPSEMVAMYERSDPQYDLILKKREKQNYTFLLTSQMELYEDENRPSAVCDGFYETDFKESCRRIMQEIRDLKKL